MLDFGKLFAGSREHFKYYEDLSDEGDYIAAIKVIYDLLRWAETKQDARCVLIANFMQLLGKDVGTGCEHKEALFDRIFRATSGK